MGEVFARRYELLDPVADGGMGSVWLVLDHEDGSVKAAKLLRHSDAGTLLRFIREQATRIDHPNVLTPLSWAGEDDTVLFTMPLMRGGSVAMLIGDWGALPASWAATVVDQTLAALEAVHRSGVVHRDVKPANLLLEATGSGRPQVRLSDFGIAAPLDQPRLTMASTVLGTPGYLPPGGDEHGPLDPAQDLYAVATVGLEMLIGHPPPFGPGESPVTPLGQLLTRARGESPANPPVTATEFRRDLAPFLSSSWHAEGVEVLDQFAGPTTASAERTGPVTLRMSRPGPSDSPTVALTTQRRPVPPLSILLIVIGVVLLVSAAWLALG